jgi:hypothetical protein
MKKIITVFSTLVMAITITSCSVTRPMSISAAPIGTRVGISKTSVILGIRTNKSFGIAEAAHNGKITGGVGVADLKITSSIFSFICYKKEIIVYGN